MLLMALILAMNGLSVAGMAIVATIALPELLRRGCCKIMMTGVIQAGCRLGILIRQPAGKLWLTASCRGC